MSSINRICRILGISKNTYYDCENPDQRFSAKYEKLKSRVKAVIKDRGSYGIKRIKSELFRRYGLHVGRDALQRLLKLWGLQLRRKIRKPKIGLIKKILILLADRTNLLIRTNIVRPLQAITGDITEIWYDNFKKKAYLCVHKDVFGQMVCGWDLSQRMTEDLAIESFGRAAKNIERLAKRLKIAAGKILCHQDRGSQFTGYEYVDNVLKSNFVLSYSAPGTPTHNPGQESFFGRFKEENHDELNEIKDFKNLEKFIKKQINDYNRGRLHTSIGNQTPAGFTKNFFKNNSLKQPKNWFSIFRT